MELGIGVENSDEVLSKRLEIGIIIGKREREKKRNKMVFLDTIIIRY